MKAALENNGWTTQTKVVVLADGADGLKNLVQTTGIGIGITNALSGEVLESALSADDRGPWHRSG
jgi:hypothetical protein